MSSLEGQFLILGKPFVPTARVMQLSSYAVVCPRNPDSSFVGYHPEAALEPAPLHHCQKRPAFFRKAWGKTPYLSVEEEGDSCSSALGCKECRGHQVSLQFGMADITIRRTPFLWRYYNKSFIESVSVISK